ncbi:MAG: IS3 family transposase [Bacillota bacterium]
MLDRNEKGITVKKQAELLEVNRTSVYYRPVQKPDPDIEIMHMIDEIYTRWPHYGYRRITKELQNRNIPINRKRVLRLMRHMGIYGIAPGPNLSKRNHQHHIYPYLLRGVKPERGSYLGYRYHLYPDDRRIYVPCGDYRLVFPIHSELGAFLHDGKRVCTQGT